MGPLLLQLLPNSAGAADAGAAPASALTPVTHATAATVSTPLCIRLPSHPTPAHQVREEIISNVEATYKETDLFKMFQTGDLANLDALPPEQAAKLPTVRRLRDAIYAPEFRQFISHITGGW